MSSNQPTSAGLRVLSSALNAASNVFVGVTFVTSLGGLVANAWVAADMARDGEWLWCWIVTGNIAAAHLVYALVGFTVLRRSAEWKPIRAVVLFLPLAHFFPHVQFVMHEYRRHSRHQNVKGSLLGQNDRSQRDRAPSDGERPVATNEEFRAAAVSRMVAERFQEADQNGHLRQFGLFYLEMLMESLPQTAVHVLAIGFIGRGSPAQFVAIALGMVSMLSKAFIVSQAYDVIVVFFKYALASHDIFSFFYLLSTLVAPTDDHEMSFFGIADVSWIGCIWLWKIAVFTVIAALHGVLRCLAAIVQCIACHTKASNQNHITFAAVSVAGLAHGLLALEVCKLTWVNVLSVVLYGGPSAQTDSRSATLSSFLINDDAARKKFRHVLECLIVHDTGFVSQCTDEIYQTETSSREVPKDVDGHWRLGSMPLVMVLYQRGLRQALTQQRRSPGRLLAKDPSTQNTPTTDVGEATSSGQPDAERRFRCYSTLWSFMSGGDPAVERISVREVVRCFSEGARCCTKDSWRLFLRVSAVAALIVGALLSTAYPFVTAVHKFPTHTPLQAMLFYGTCASLLMVMCLLYPAARTVPYHRSILALVSHSEASTDHVREWVAAYHEHERSPADVATAPVIARSSDLTDPVVAGFHDIKDIPSTCLNRAAPSAHHARTCCTDPAEHADQPLSGDADRHPVHVDPEPSAALGLQANLPSLTTGTFASTFCGNSISDLRRDIQ